MRPAVRRPVFALALPIALVLAAIGVASIAAQDATPAAFPFTPDPAGCRVAPRPPDAVLGLLASPPAAPPAMAGGAAVPAETGLPAGTPADDVTASAIVATVVELVACNNAGELARVFAFYTDDVLRSAIAGDPAATLALTFAAPPSRGSQAELVDVRDIRSLDDGRAAAVVEVKDAKQTAVAVLVFVRTGDRWLIAERVDLRVGGTPTA